MDDLVGVQEVQASGNVQGYSSAHAYLPDALLAIPGRQQMGDSQAMGLLAVDCIIIIIIVIIIYYRCSSGPLGAP